MQRADGTGSASSIALGGRQHLCLHPWVIRVIPEGVVRQCLPTTGNAGSQRPGTQNQILTLDVSYKQPKIFAYGQAAT